MARFCLQMAFAVAAFRVIAPKVFDHFEIQHFRFFYPLFYLPAVILGIRSWLRVPSFARSWPVAACVAVVWIGVVHAGEWRSEWDLYRGFRSAMMITIVLPLGALIVQKRCWLQCAKTFVFTSAVVLVTVLWFTYWVDYDPSLRSAQRFGMMYSSDGTARLVNPNHLGSQLALAAVLVFILHLRGQKRQAHLPQDAKRPRQFSLGWTAFLSMGCLLTASRGAFVAWLGGMGLLFVWGTKTQDRGRLRDLVVQAAFLGLLAIALATAGGPTPWSSMVERFSDSGPGSLSSLGGRLPIWRNAYVAWRSSTTHTLFGTGMGLAEELLGEYDEAAVKDEFGVLQRDTHSTFVNWLLSFGLLGLVPGVCLLIVAFRKARELDRREGMLDRQSILAVAVLFSMTGVFYNRFYWLAAAPLILAMLSERRPDLPLASEPLGPHANAAILARRGRRTDPPSVASPHAPIDARRPIAAVSYQPGAPDQGETPG